MFRGCPFLFLSVAVVFFPPRRSGVLTKPMPDIPIHRHRCLLPSIWCCHRSLVRVFCVPGFYCRPLCQTGTPHPQTAAPDVQPVSSFASFFSTTFSCRFALGQHSAFPPSRLFLTLALPSLSSSPHSCYRLLGPCSYVASLDLHLSFLSIILITVSVAVVFPLTILGTRC